MEEAQENTKMSQTTENEKKEDKVANGRKTSRFEGVWRKLLSSALTCFNVKFVKSNMRRMSNLKIV